MKKFIILGVKYIPIITAVLLYVFHILRTVLYLPLLSPKIVLSMAFIIV